MTTSQEAFEIAMASSMEKHERGICQIAWREGIAYGRKQALEEVQDDSVWQPIETAPKDGSMILLGKAASIEDETDSISTAGYWQPGWEDSVDDMGCDDGFVDVNYQVFNPPRSFGAEKYRTSGSQPTHWMPLPKPPAIQELMK